MSLRSQRPAITDWIYSIDNQQSVCGQTVAAEKLTDPIPKIGKCAVQFLSENRS
jgi:hypothetical protein